MSRRLARYSYQFFLLYPGGFSHQGSDSSLEKAQRWAALALPEDVVARVVVRLDRWYSRSVVLSTEALEVL